MPVWHALLDGSQDDVGHVKRLLTRSNFTFDQIDGKFALSAPAFQQSNDREQIIAASTELRAAINTSLRLSVKAYTGFELHGVAEKRDDGMVHRILIAAGASYNLSGGDAVAIISDVAAYGMAGTIGSPVRSKEERLMSLIQRDPLMRVAAKAFHFEDSGTRH